MMEGMVQSAIPHVRPSEVSRMHFNRSKDKRINTSNLVEGSEISVKTCNDTAESQHVLHHR